MSMYSPSESAQILMARQKVNNGTITKEELKEALALLSKARAQSAATSAASKVRKAAKGPVDSNNLLNELEGL